MVTEGDNVQVLQLLVNGLLFGACAVLLVSVRRLNVLNRGQAEINRIWAERLSVEIEARKLGDSKRRG